jgi:hypothetical protein
MAVPGEPHHANRQAAGPKQPARELPPPRAVLAELSGLGLPVVDG